MWRRNIKAKTWSPIKNKSDFPNTWFGLSVHFETREKLQTHAVITKLLNKIHFLRQEAWLEFWDLSCILFWRSLNATKEALEWLILQLFSSFRGFIFVFYANCLLTLFSHFFSSNSLLHKSYVYIYFFFCVKLSKSGLSIFDMQH